MTADQIMQLRTLIAHWRTTASKITIPASTALEQAADQLEEALNRMVLEQREANP